MSTISQGRVKRIHAEFRGDEAVEIDMLEIILRMGEISRTRIESDTRLMRLALKALDRAMTGYSARTGQRYPSYAVLMRHLDEDTNETTLHSSQVVSLPKSSAGAKD